MTFRRICHLGGATLLLLALAASPFSAGVLATEISSASGPSDAYWIFFRDKGGMSDAEYRQSLATVAAGYSPAAIHRREVRGTLTEPFGFADLPVADAYVSAVQANGATMRTASSWLNAVSVQANAQQLSAIAALPYVDHVQPVARISAPSVTNATPAEMVPQSPAAAATFYGTAESQLAQIKIQQVHNLGYTGSGVTIGVLDTGFKLTHEAFNDPGHPLSVTAKYDFINNSSATTADTSDDQHVHGTYVLGVMGAYKPNVLVGAAYKASFLLAKTEVVPTETPVEEDHWVAGLQWMESKGADVVTSSLGYLTFDAPYNKFPPSYFQSNLNGVRAVTTRAANAATLAGLPIINAAGNFGYDSDPTTSTLIAPADAELVITVGAVDTAGVLAPFSSTGRSSLPWIKPEVLATGMNTQTVNPNFDGLYLGVNGTSLSTPLVASTVALMLDANPNLTVAQIRQALFSTASRANIPDDAAHGGYYREGYGIIDAYAAVRAAEALVVPEPSTWGLAAAGWIGAAIWGWRRSRRPL